MLSDTVRMPAFAPEEIARQRQQILSTLQVNVESPEWVADAVFDRLVYGVHPYGLPQHGTPASIASLSREDLVAFHERFYAPNNAILAVVGDLTAEEAFSGVEKVFGAWARREQAALSLAAPPEPAKRSLPCSMSFTNSAPTATTPATAACPGTWAKRRVRSVRRCRTE